MKKFMVCYRAHCNSFDCFSQQSQQFDTLRAAFDFAVTCSGTIYDPNTKEITWNQAAELLGVAL